MVASVKGVIWAIEYIKPNSENLTVDPKGFGVGVPLTPPDVDPFGLPVLPPQPARTPAAHQIQIATRARATLGATTAPPVPNRKDLQKGLTHLVSTAPFGARITIIGPLHLGESDVESTAVPEVSSEGTPPMGSLGLRQQSTHF